MNKNDKVELVEQLREELADAPSVIVATSMGIDANSMNELRAKIRASGSQYRIVKNTLLRRVVEGTDLEALNEHFTGPTAIAYNAEDAVAPAKVLVDFQKDNEKLELRAAWLNGDVLDTSGVVALSKMPGKDELRSKLLNVFQGVATNFVRVISAAQRDFVGVLAARKDSL